MYEAVMLLGVTTDTEDMTGTVLTEQDAFVTKEELLNSAELYGKSPYGEHLRRVALNKLRY